MRGTIQNQFTGLYVLNHSEDPLASAMLLLAKAITQNFSNPTNNCLRASSNTRNRAVVQGDRVNIQSRNFGNVGRNNRRAYVQGEVIEGINATNETANVQRIVRTPTPGNTSTGQCYNCGGTGHYARNCPKPRVRDSKYFMEQMLLAKQDEAGVILSDEQNDFLFANASRMEEIEELSANICLMARIQPADQNSDDEPSYESAFVSKVQSSSINENDEQAYPTHTNKAYGAIRAENQNLLVTTISELKARMKNGENGKSVNTKFDKTHGSQSFLCVTPLNKNASQKQTVVLKTKENHVESKPVTLQTSHNKQTGTHQNTNVISPGMYRVVTQQESQTNKTKNVLSSTGMNATSSVKRPKSRDSHVKTSVLDVSKNEAKKEAVYVRKNKQTDNTFAKVVSNKENVIDVAVANASKAKTLLCVSCMQSVLIPCHDKCVAKHKLNVRSNARRTFSVNSRIPKSSETTFVAPKTRFSEKATQSKTLDTTSVASKSKIDEASASKARDKVSSAFKKKESNMRDKPLSPFMLNKIRTSRVWKKWFESQPNVIWTPVNTKPHANTNPSNTKPLVSVKRWIVKLPSCPCVGSSCVAGSPDRSMGC
ncbi:retrovirus-related pol polyprotein from transposon TNT 1-94 [Tanacetum coccineum]